MVKDPHVPGGVRLQKLLSQAGVASRRHAEKLIVSGRVKVNGQIVRQLGTRVDPKATLHVDNKRVFRDETNLTLALNKPFGVLSSMSDPEGRDCLANYLADYNERLFHVGRLDQNSEGLILVTNDGELANRLTHPSYEIKKTYMTTVAGVVNAASARAALEGVELEDGPIVCDEFVVKDSLSDRSLVQITIHEGRKRVVRRLMKQLGHPVIRLVRTRIGSIHLGHLHSGATRKIEGDQLAELMKLVDL
ncbi:MAG: pseudouridine synthase [Actinomycetaceae bacterium]|nr:pseudouridine synthase [Actinomycetaceae bacterium]